MSLRPRELSTLRKRLSGRRKAVTVCVAGINHSNLQPYVIAACDRKISFFGGWASAEGVGMKISGLNKDWTVMFSGPVSPMTALIDAIRERTEKMKPMNFRTFARLCREIYRKERKLLIESEVLGDYDVESYSEYVGMRKLEPEFHARLTEKIKDVEQEWNLLFAGFDKKRRAHIFTITECGRISFCDSQGYAAIGSGALRALLALSAYPFKKNIPLSEGIFGIAAAKFAAEAADGVGEEIILTVLEPNTDASPAFGEHGLKKLRGMWIDLPRFPKAATTQVWAELNLFQSFGYLGRNSSPEPSISEKVALGITQ
jgi:hypothetical protein